MRRDCARGPGAMPTPFGAVDGIGFPRTTPGLPGSPILVPFFGGVVSLEAQRSPKRSAPNKTQKNNRLAPPLSLPRRGRLPINHGLGPGIPGEACVFISEPFIPAKSLLEKNNLPLSYYERQV